MASSHPLRRFGLLALLGGTTALATSCAVNRPEEINEAYKDVLDQRHNHYQFKPGDKVSIAIFNRQTDLNQREVLVLPDGRCDLFFMDNYPLAGKTVGQLEAELKVRTTGEVRESDVSIHVTPKDEVAYLVGQFEKPGTVALSTKMTLSEAISSVGGARITGDTDWVLLRRPYRDPKHPDLFRIDINDEAEQLFLLPGDQIVLNRTFLAGLVNYVHEYVFGAIGGSPLTYLNTAALVF